MSNTDALTNVIHARSDVPFTDIQIRTLTVLQRSRQIGAEIIARHSANGTFDLLSAGAIRILSISMAIVYGVARDDVQGLLISPRKEEDEKALRIRLSRAAGLAERSNYEPIRELIQHQLVRRISMGGNSPDGFVLKMPDDLLGTCEQADAQVYPSLSCDGNPESPSQDSDGQPLTEPGLARASCDGSLFRDGVRHYSVTDHYSVTECKNVKSDSEPASGRARASCDGHADCSSIAIASKLKDLKALRLRERWSVARILIEKGGMGGPRAGALAKHPNATLEQIAGAIVLCDIEEATNGLRYKGQSGREAFITACVKKKWDVPLEQDLLLEGRSEHDAEAEAAEYEQISQNAPAGERGNLPAILPPPVDAPLITSRTLELLTALPDAERIASATRQAAEQAKQKVMRPRTYTPLDRRRILGTLDPDRRQQLLDQVLRRYSPEQIAAWFPFEPMDLPSVIDAVCELAEGGAR